MPIINAQILSGRTAAQKDLFLRELVELVVRRLEVPEHAVRVVLTEFEPELWMVGTKTAAELRAEAAKREAVSTDGYGCIRSAAPTS